MKLDLKSFKHLKSDKNSTTLKHKQGHELKISHNSLSPDFKAQLDALSKVPQQDATPLQQGEAKQHFDDGGKVPVPPPNPGDMPTPEEKLHNVTQGSKKSDEKGGPPADSPTKTGDWTHWWKAEGGPICYDDGGKVPAPSSPSTDTNKQNTATQISQGSQRGGTPSDSPVSTGDWSHIWKAEGGEVEPKEQVIDYSKFKRQPSPSGGTLDYKKIKEEKKEMNRQEPPNRKKRMADGGSCESCGGPMHYAEGTPDIGGVKAIVPQPLDENNPNSLDMSAKRQQYNDIVAGHNAGFFGSPEDSGAFETKRAQFSPDGQAPQQFDPQAWNQMEKERTQSKQANASQVASEALKTAEYNQAAQQAGVPTKPTDDVPQNQDTNNALSQPQQAQANQPQGQNHAQSQGQSQDPFSMGSFNAGVNEAANIQQKQLSNQIQARQQALDSFQNHYAELDNERKAHISDIQDGYIDPNKYWDDHSKIASGIGMVLAGFNPAGKPNAAIEFLQHQMDNSIKAQQSNLDAKNNLLSANLRHFGDLNQATQMTQAMMNDALGAQMQQAGLQAKNPLARQAALGASGTLIQNAAMFQRQLAMQRTMMQLANGGGGPETQSQAIAMMSAVNPEGAKVYRDAFVPGIGMSKSLTPVPQEVKDRINSYQNVNRMLQEAMNFKQDNPKAGFSIQDRYRAETLMANLSNEMRTAEKMGVIKPSEMSMMEGMMGGNPAAFSAAVRTNPKLQEMMHLKQNEYNNLLQNNGLPTPHVAPQPQYKTVNGVKYMRGPNGEPVKVK